jgi:hypothetical protein
MCCDTPGPDPAVGAAANEEASIAQQGLSFSEDYYNTTEKPLVQQETAAATQTMNQQQQLFSMNYGNAQLASQQYQQYGIPAQQNMYNMASQYNSSDWQEQQAQAAMGDVTNAKQVQQTSMNQNMASRGISANSGMALYNQGIASNQATASGAAAANQARSAARSLGMSLTQSAANMSQGGMAQVTGLGQAASGDSLGSFNAATNAVSSGQAGQAAMSSAFSNTAGIIGNSANTLNQQSIANQNAAAQSNAAMGEGVGALGTAAALYAGSASGSAAIGSAWTALLAY